MPIDAKSAWAKHQRGLHHSDAFKQTVVRWFKTNKFKITFHHNEDFTGFSNKIHFPKNPELKDWALVFFDAIQNFRSALDHVVYAVIASQHDPVPDGLARSSGFPICDSADNFRLQRKKIDALPDAVKAVVERFQPYNRPERETPPLLAMLRDLNDVDKHRLTKPIVHNARSGDIKFLTPLPGGTLYQIEGQLGEIHNGAEIVSIAFERPHPDMKYEVGVNLVVGMTHAPGPTGAFKTDGLGLLRIIGEEVKKVLTEIEAAAP